MNSFLQICFQTVLVIMAVLLVIVGVVAFINTSEQNECHAWAEQAQTLKGFYITKWQSAQCATWSITINAPIK